MSTGIPQGRGIQLQEQGWTRRFTAMGRRLNESVELYCQLGFETLLEPAELDGEYLSGAEGCERCIVTTLARTIYTRPRRTVNADEHS
jgi:hypothetical protein